VRLPDFLIIGAMKAGTTTLFRDLEVNPACFFSMDKEPHNLVHDAVLTDAGREAYSAMFQRARPEQLCAEASTGYTKRPTNEGVAARARKLLGEGLKVIYIVREPVSRTVSHHYHSFTYNETALTVDDAVRQSSSFIDYSRYAWQLEPWLAEFGRAQVHIIRFETYVKNRAATVEEVSKFLGIPSRPDLIDEEAVYNKGDSRPIHKGFWTVLNRSALYRKGLRRIIPRPVRELAYRTILPRGPQRPNPPTLATVDYILERVRDDCDRLQTLIGLPGPVWDLEKVRQKYAQPESPAPPGAEHLPRLQANS
jgi:hypothetical protein